MANREFLMLAQEFDPDKHNAAGWFWSEKLDGQRAFWDGGISRGLLASEVPYANTGKDARFKEPPRATGLWSRYGKVIHAPEEWLGSMPDYPVDMELWMGRGQFQALRTITGSIGLTIAAWMQVRGMILALPNWNQVLLDGTINNANWPNFTVGRSQREWVHQKLLKQGGITTGATTIEDDVDKAEKFFGKGLGIDDLLENAPNKRFNVLRQTKLPQVGWEKVVAQEALRVTKRGGEGLILRHPFRQWEPKRVPTVLKVKPQHDAEGTVVGFTWGRKTNKGSRLLGKMGALILKLDDGKRLELSGFTDQEREVVQHDPGCTDMDCSFEPRSREGEDASEHWEPKSFPRGTRVTFVYREKSVDGIPKEARYLRKREAE